MEPARSVRPWDAEHFPSDDNTLRVVVHKKLYAQNQKDADQYNGQTKPQITVTGNFRISERQTPMAR